MGDTPVPRPVASMRHRVPTRDDTRIKNVQRSPPIQGRGLWARSGRSPPRLAPASTCWTLRLRSRGVRTSSRAQQAAALDPNAARRHAWSRASGRARFRREIPRAVGPRPPWPAGSSAAIWQMRWSLAVTPWYGPCASGLWGW